MGGPSVVILLFFLAIPHGFIVLVMVVETIVQGCGSGDTDMHDLRVE